MSDIRFDGRTAIITGAGGGLGREYALDLAKRGCNIVVNDLGGSRDGTGSGTSAADAVADEIKALGGKAIANYDSVTEVKGGQNMVQAALDAFGSVDILINNAGILRDKTFNKMEEAQWDAVIAVHLKGAFCVTQPALLAMREKNYGRIVFTASTSGLYGNFGQANYGAAKAAMVGLMNVLKLENAKYDIKFNTVAPNAWSRMTEDVIAPEYKDKVKPKFNVPMVVYLCSEQNKDNGMIFTMSAGWFGRTAIVCSPGVCLGDTVRDIAAEEIRDNFAQICDLSKAQPFNSGAEVFVNSAPLFMK